MPGRRHTALIAVLTVVLVVGVAGVAGDSRAEATPGGHGSTWTAATVPLPNGGIDYDHLRDQILVGVAQSVPVLGNHLVELDPHDGDIGRSLFVGSQPGRVVVADDASRAYVGLNGSPEVIEVDLATFTVTRRTDLGADPHYGPMFAQDIEVQPGHPDVIAVARLNRSMSPAENGVAIYDKGAVRPNQTTKHFGVDRVTWDSDPATLYGFGFSSPSDYRRMHVDDSGVTPTQWVDGVLRSGLFEIEFSGGLIYSTSGEILDPATTSVVEDLGVEGALEVDEARHKVFVAGDGQLRRFDTVTRNLDWTLPVTALPERDLVDAGNVLVAADDDGLMLLGPGTTASSFVLPEQLDTVARTWEQFDIPVIAERLVAAPAGGLVYAPVRTGAPTYADELVEIDTTTGQVLRTLALGDDPYRIAISEDGSTLMVGHAGGSHLTEVDAQSFSAIRTIALPVGEYAEDIAARPAFAHSFAVVVTEVPPWGSVKGTLLVEDGVVLPARGANVSGPREITFADSHTTLYGVSSTTFHTLSAGDSGIDVVSLATDLMERPSFGGRMDIVHHDGFVYASAGDVIAPAQARLVGTYSGSGAPVPIPAHDRMVLVARDGIYESELGSYRGLARQDFDAEEVWDAASAGTSIVVATADGLVVIPLGLDDRSPPAAPTGTTAFAGDSTAWVTWTPTPSGPDHAPATGYVVTSDPPGGTCTTATTACTVTGLVNGVTYRFSVAATSVRGTGPASDTSATVTPTACDGSGSGPFVDVEADHAFCRDIEWMTGNGVADGYPDGAFRPTAVVRRQALSAFLYRLAAEGFVPPVTPSFSDVPTDHPFYAEIEWLVAEGLATGFDDGRFRPTGPMTRQALAAMLYRLAGSPPPAGSISAFTDVPPSHPFFDEITWLASMGIATGFSDGSFRPGAEITRQAVAAFLFRFDFVILSAPELPDGRCQLRGVADQGWSCH